MHYFTKLAAVVGVFASVSATSLAAQATSVPFGLGGHDTTQPVEIVSDTFTVNQNRGTAEFTGNVVVGQGDMRLSAAKIDVEYSAETEGEARQIGRLIASGGVTLVTGGQAAEAQTAIYSIKNGNIILQGNVLITQGENAMAGQKVTITLSDGSAQVEGRVKTIFKTGGSE
jgi:lipopolysaccharide export system protein LptA